MPRPKYRYSKYHTLDRSFRIARLVKRSPGLDVDELAEMLALPRQVVHRLTSGLVDSGWLERRVSDGKVLLYGRKRERFVKRQAIK